MSCESLATGSGSSTTLARGYALANQPLQQLLQLKEEPLDDEEIAIRKEMQVRDVSKTAICEYNTPPQ